jgi:hypothetical protein
MPYYTLVDNWKVITDMTKLYMKYKLHKDAHVFRVLDWCTWAVNHGHVEYVYDGDEMIGFMDWIRSDTIPEDYNYQKIIDSGNVDTGKIGIVLSACVVRGKDTLRKLINMARSKNESCQTMCWHDSRKMARMRYFSCHPGLVKQEGGKVYAT